MRMTISDWLPMPFWLGPPLPRFLGVSWPWKARPSDLTSIQIPTISLSAPQETVTYDNAEEVEFPEGFDPDTFMPRKIIIHRKAKVLK